MIDLLEKEGDWVLHYKTPVEIEGRAVIEQRINRRIKTLPGDLFYDPSFGFRLKNQLNAPATENIREKILVEIQEDLENDPAVLECDVTRNNNGYHLKIKLIDQTSIQKKIRNA